MQPERRQLPFLEQMRLMDDQALIELQTDVRDSIQALHHALEFSDRVENDPEWARRARGALHVHERCIANIRNLLLERRSKGRNANLNDLFRAVGAFLDDDSDENFDAMEAAWAVLSERQRDDAVA